MCGLSVFTFVWQPMHVAVGGSVAWSSVSTVSWHITHCRPCARCALWLYGMGCSGGGGGLYSAAGVAAAPCCADGVSTAKKTTAAQTIAAAAMILEARIYT